MKKRMIAVLLTTSMVLGLAACGSSDDTTTSSASTESAESAESTTSDDGEEAVESTGITFPLEESITVEIAARRMDSYSVFEDTVFMQEIEEMTNINIEWLDWSTTVYDEKKSLMFSTGDMPDAIYGTYLLSGVELVTYSEQGYFYPLNELIDAGYMPNYAAALELRPDMELHNTAPDGNIYNIPHVNELSAGILANNAVMINTEWLDTVGMDMPATTDELYDVLVAFDEAGDINGNGLDDEIPMSFLYEQVNSGWGSMVGWFGTALGSGTATPVVAEGGELIYAQATDDFKDALVYFNQLYTEGLVDQEIFTMDLTTYDARNISDPFSVGVVSAWNEDYLDGDDEVYEYLPALTSPNGNEPQWMTNGFSYSAIGFVMSADCEYPAEVAAWADLMIGGETALQSFFAWPEYLEEVEDGLYRVVTAEDGTAYTKAEMSWYAPINSALFMVLVPEYYDTYEWTNYEANKLEANDVYGDYLNDEGVFFTSWFTTQDEADELSIITTDIESYVDQMVASFVTTGGIEEGWDTYLAQLETLGLSRMLEIRQEIYDRNTGN
ncbi:MAG: extracellular solute-binding protein [Lachnospiraceae bacterium]